MNIRIWSHLVGESTIVSGERRLVKYIDADITVFIPLSFLCSTRTLSVTVRN